MLYTLQQTYEKSYRKHPAQWTYKSLQTYALYEINMNRTANFLYIKMFYVFHKHLRDILLFVVVNCSSKQLSCQCQITDLSQHVQRMRIECFLNHYKTDSVTKSVFHPLSAVNHRFFAKSFIRLLTDVSPSFNTQG